MSENQPTKELYAERPIEDLAEHYMRHLHAMTVEGLHSISAIAAELAFRDERIEGLERERGRLAEALRLIERWRDFPSTGETWPSGQPMSYAAAFGSNGERDFMRKIAKEALMDDQG